LAAYSLNKGDFDKAIAERERALALDPSEPGALTVYGNSLRNAGRPEEAIPVFQKAIRLNPFSSAYNYTNFSNALRMTRRLEEAVSASKKAIQLSSGNIHAHISLATTYRVMGRCSCQLQSKAIPDP
jgi:tetratricopeptide (TPR) repeat protein